MSIVKTVPAFAIASLFLLPLTACGEEKTPSSDVEKEVIAASTVQDEVHAPEASTKDAAISSPEDFRKAQQEVMAWEAESSSVEEAKERRREAMEWARAQTDVTSSGFKRPRAAAATTIDGVYLAGAWCYASVDVMGTSQEAAINFLFDRDGGLLYAKTKYGDPTEPGEWSVRGGQMFLIPTNLGGGAGITQIDADSFTLDQMGLKHHFTRGACEKEAQQEEVVLDIPDYVPIYITPAGEGILRYRITDGSTGPFWLAVGTFTGYEPRPFETLAGDYGPYPGPEIAIAFPIINIKDVGLDKIAFAIYETNPYRHIAYFKPVIDPDQAEPMANCGAIRPVGANDIGACSRE